MTPSPAFAVIYLIVAFSIIGTVTETAADHGGNKTSTILEAIDRNNVVMDETRESFPMATSRRTNFDVENEKFINFNNVHIKTNIDNRLVFKDNLEKRINTKTVKSFVTFLNSLVDNNNRMRHFDTNSAPEKPKSRRKREEREECRDFKYSEMRNTISHPKSSNDSTYARGIECETIIDASAAANQIISLDFVDMFHIEDHPNCDYDYLEIRDGMYGYSNIIKRYCGETFPTTIKSTGPYLWLKFHSDETIEYEGFRISFKFEHSSSVRLIPPSCNINETGAANGTIDTEKIPPDCISQTQKQTPLDVLWTIETAKDTKIYLNFTDFRLQKPNECNENYVEVFGAKTDIPSRFEIFCGSMANSVITKDSPGGNIMFVHLYASSRAKDTKFKAIYTAFRTLNIEINEKCTDEEFDCEDNTCIAKALKCDQYAHCRLKADEDYELCKGETESIVSQPHILTILVIFSLILSGMSFVFLFKCIRKLVQDHKIIKEHIRQSCEDRLDSLDARQLHRDSESQPRASLERDNHTNEMYKKQRSLSRHKQSSIDSDFIQETQIDISDEPWRRNVDSVPIETESVRIEQNGRTRRSDFSKKEETMRKDSRREKIDEEVRERKEIKDASVGVPDTKESGCQTRESLFQTCPPSSDGTESGSGGDRAFSTFGYSGATLARPSPPPVAASHITITQIELLKSCPSQESKTKKLPDRRPMSSETTRSAPDVIIVSKPIR